MLTRSLLGKRPCREVDLTPHKHAAKAFHTAWTDINATFDNSIAQLGNRISLLEDENGKLLVASEQANAMIASLEAKNIQLQNLLNDKETALTKSTLLNG